jgi:DNA-directed RNA polymerase specialized sigma24 family protein
VRDKAVIDLIGDEELRELANKICSLPDDLIQEVALVLMELSEDKWQQINEGGYLRYYVVRTMLNMATSPRSSFSKLYNLHNYEQIDYDREDYDEEKESDIQMLEMLMEELYWYDRKILEMWLEEGSYRKVSAKVGIPFKSIGNSVKRALETLKQNYYGIHLERLVRGNIGLHLDRSYRGRHSDKEVGEHPRTHSD